MIWLERTGLPVSDIVENTYEESVSKTRKTKYGKTHLDFLLNVSQLMA